MVWAYQRELTSLRQEVKPGVTGLNKIRHFPKLDGLNVEPSTYTYEIYNPSGTLQTSGTANATDHGDYLELNCQPSTTLTASWAYGENYRVEWTWNLSAPTRPNFVITFFDVVKYPWHHPEISLNDLVEERPDVQEILERHGEMIGLSTQIAETAAAIYAVRARVELDALVREAIYEKSYQASPERIGASSYSRPNLIINRERFNRVERKLAMMLIYLADAGDPQGQSESAGIYREYKELSNAAWKSVGPLEFDLNEDGTPDVKQVISRTVSLRREQAGG